MRVEENWRIRDRPGKKWTDVITEDTGEERVE